MEAVIVSPRYEIEIPRAVRESMGIKPGQKFDLVVGEGVIRLIPISDPEATSGDADTATAKGAGDSR